MKTVYIFFGEMGCGKTYVGSQYAEKHDIKFFEGDSVIPPRMLEKVSKFRPITRDLIEEYLDILCDTIADQMENCDKLVVSQALYSEEDRVSVKIFLEALGYRVNMWWVRCKWHQNLQQLMTRKNGWKWALYWLFNKPFFQKPKHDHQVYQNLYLR